MPILHTQLTEQGQTPDGKAIQVPSAVVLLTKGPVVQVSITIQEALATVLVQQGKTVPAPVSGFALIDTGASNTCIDDQAAQSMGLPVIAVARSRPPTGMHVVLQRAGRSNYALNLVMRRYRII